MKTRAMTITLLAAASLLGGCIPHHETMDQEPLEPMASTAAPATDAQGQPVQRRGFRMAVVAHAPFHKGTVRAAVDWRGKRPDAMIDVEASAHPLPAAVELRAATHARGPGGVALDVASPAGRAEAAYGADVGVNGASE